MGLVSSPSINSIRDCDSPEAGADIVKLFPAGILGIEYIKAVRNPLKHIAMSAVGNVTPGNCAEFPGQGAVVLERSNLTDRKAIACGDFEKINNAREYVRNKG